MILEFFKRNEWSILMLIGGMTLGAAIMWLDARHSMKGEAEKTILMMEIRKQEAYEENDPDSKASPARKMIQREAADMLKQLEAK